MYSTFIAIALGYDVGNDFTYNNSVAFAVSLGLLSTGEAEAIVFRGFLRGDLVLLNYRALSTHVKGSNVQLDSVLGI
jgi:lipopolysaccharide assembly outer membrane protein LptD (OstA)